MESPGRSKLGHGAAAWEPYRNMGRIQRTVIHYNCIGAFEGSDRRKIQLAEITMKTRKGATVTYAPTQIAVEE